jgi:hypothetical protein
MECGKESSYGNWFFVNRRLTLKPNRGRFRLDIKLETVHQGEATAYLVGKHGASFYRFRYLGPSN